MSIAANDPVNAPSHYRGRSGLQSIEITHAYRLGPDLTQAVDYILRAGRKTADPRQDLGKAAFYLRYASRHGRDLVFGFPMGEHSSIADIVADFDLCEHRAKALGVILGPFPYGGELEDAARSVDCAIEAYTAAQLPVANGGRAA